MRSGFVGVYGSCCGTEYSRAPRRRCHIAAPASPAMSCSPATHTTSAPDSRERRSMTARDQTGGSCLLRELPPATPHRERPDCDATGPFGPDHTSVMSGPAPWPREESRPRLEHSWSGVPVLGCTRTRLHPHRDPCVGRGMPRARPPGSYLRLVEGPVLVLVGALCSALEDSGHKKEGTRVAASPFQTRSSGGRI